jgi:uncharacterized membrane protein YfcA
MAVGLPLGYMFILKFGEQPVFKIILGAVLLVYMFLGVFNVQIRKKLPRFLGVPFGAVGGWLGGAFSSGGPPIVIYLFSRVDDPREMKATLQVIFLAVTLVRIITVYLGPVGFTFNVFKISLFAIPACIPVLILGNLLSRKFSPERFKKTIYYMIGAFGVITMVRGIIE